MVIFESSQRHLAMLGIKGHQPTVNHGFNKQNLMIIAMFGTSSILTTAYLSNDPNFGEEFIITVYAGTASILSTVDVTILVWKTTKLFEFINSVDSFTQMSE